MARILRTAHTLFSVLTLCLLIAGCSSSSNEPAQRRSNDVAQAFRAGSMNKSSLQSSNSKFFSGRKVASVKPKEDSKQETAKKTPPKAVERSVTVSLKQIASELGMSTSRLKRETTQLNNYLALGRLPKGKYCPRNLNSSKSLCKLVKSHREPVVSSDIKKVELPSTSYKGGIVPIRPHHFARQQKMHYSRLMKSIARQPAQRVLAWVPRMLRDRGCPRNLSAAAIRKLENLLPQKAARLAMEKLYKHASVCLRPKDAGYHPTHFRQALLFKLWRKPNSARAAINRAALAKMDKLQEARTLFWAGELQTSKGARNQHWRKLVVNHPLTHHSLEVWRRMQVDPYQIFTSRPLIELERKPGRRDRDLNRAMRWLEALYLVDNKSSAKKLGNWIIRKYEDTLSESNLMYISAMKSSQNTPLNAIIFLTRRVRENPKFLNEQTLRMLFPRPYMEIFAEQSRGIDEFLLMSIARQESGFNPRAKSHANAHGLLQLLPSTAKEVAGRRVANLYDKKTNVSLGVKYLEKLVKRFGSVELSLAAYNAGPSRVPTWKRRYPTDNMHLFMDLIPFKETRNYVSLIVRNNYWYERLYRNEIEAIKLARNYRSPASSKTRSEVVSQLLRGR